MLCCGVGPSKIHKEALLEMQNELYNCQHQVNRSIVMGLENKLNVLLGGTKRHSFVIPGTGSAGMEACLTNFIVPGDKVVVCSSGVFGDRIAMMAKLLSAEVIKIDVDYKSGIDYKFLNKVIKENEVKLLCLVHLETSNGMLEHLEMINELKKDTNIFVLLDIVSTIGGMELSLDKWGIDIAYGSTQKCISAPSGLAIISMNSRSKEYVDNKLPRSWYWNFSSIYDHIVRGVYPYTTPMTLINALNGALDVIINGGIKSYFSSQKVVNDSIAEKLQKYGVLPVVPEKLQAPMLKVYQVNNADTKINMLMSNGLIVAGGIGTLKGKVIRIGTMGISVTPYDINKVLSIIDKSFT